MISLSPEASSRSRLSYLSVLILLTVGYLVAGKIGLSLATMHGSVSLIWPATGVALASLFLLGYRFWPGVFLGAFLVNVSTPVSIATAFSISCGNTLEALAGASLIREFSGSDARILERLRGVFSMVLFGAMAATMISATIGVISLCVGGAAPWNLFASLWINWWMGDLVGALIFTPLLFSWNRPAGFAAWQRVVEAGALMVLIALASLFVFRNRFGQNDLSYFYPYILFPFVLWASMRFTQWGAAHATVLVSFISIWGTVQGFGPFAKPTAQESLTLLHVFMVTVSLTGLFLAAVVSEAKRVQEVNKVRGRRNEIVAAISRQALSNTDIDALLRDTVARVAETLGTEYCKVLQFLPDGTKSLLRAEIGWQDGDGYVGKTISAARVDTQSDQRSHPGAPILVTPTKSDLDDGQLQQNHQMQDGMSVSIPGTPLPFGILGVDSRRQIIFTDDDREFLQSVANVLGSAIARARVEDDLRMLTSTLEQRILERTESLRRSEALAAIGVTAAKFAHEVGNPLNGMFTTVQLLERYLNKQKDEFDDVIIATASDLRKEIDRLRLLLHHFRSLAQLPALNLKPISIAAVVADILRSQESQHNEANVQFEQHLSDLPPVIVDSGALTQVLINLFQNSLEAMPRGGTITLRGTCSGNKLYLDVIDTGTGVAPGIDIFEPFATTKFSGTGLGLTVARQIMEAHGGSITLKSEAGKGAVFRLTLPIDSA